jgi:multidrug efflux pump subunit AcrA (membrane-fusion protein)
MNYSPMKPIVHEDKLPDGRQRRRTARLMGLGAIATVSLLVGFGAWKQSSRSTEAAAVLEAHKNAVPIVRTMIVKEDTVPRTIELPGNMAAFDSATLFARATGYISTRNVDIGSKGRKGDVLAVIAAPDLDRQLDQAKAQLVQLQAMVEQAQANVGSLVTADAATGTPLFSIARTDVLRVQVYVPQTAFFGIKDGDHATVAVPELPDHLFQGKVARNARALTAGTRTLLTEVDVDNKDGTLTAGLYGVVHLQIRRPNPVMLIPSQAVIFNKDGLSAAIVSGGKVELRKLELESDNGSDVEVRTGLRPGDRVIVSPPTNVRDGMRVQTS